MASQVCHDREEEKQKGKVGKGYVKRAIVEGVASVVKTLKKALNF